MNIEDISPELKEKALACKTPEELIELAKSEGIELSEDQLDAIAGGEEWYERCEHECAGYCRDDDWC